MGQCGLLPSATGAFRSNPLTERCRSIEARGDHILIGVSTGNSYFSTDRLTQLLRWSQKRFRVVDVICADTCIDTMLIAEGCAESEARQRAKRRITNVRRRIRHAVRDSRPGHASTTTHLLSDFERSDAYLAVRTRVLNTLEDHPPFTRACQAMVRCFLPAGAGDDSDDLSPRMRAGLAYVVNELPFVIDTPGILGPPTSLSCYHVLPPAVRHLYLESGGLTPVEGQGFAVITPVPPAGSEEEGSA
ncbi:hypothetical protein B1H18_31355 [Streptomyces tsukubensis]|uniref:Cyclodipeptide synthase n=1 Tax=Streptomyces tsukubensis TaxID=83656 RepID=A0A1V3ZZY9_9ACTN|nr:hypothetical protein B1H18_31355 [Streptomyces tsukubensis]